MKCRYGRFANDRAKAIFRILLRDWASIIAIALVLAVLGPYDTFLSMTLPVRVAYWLIATLGTAALVRGARRLLQFWPLTKHWPIIALRMAAVVLGSVPAALLLSQFYRALIHAPQGAFGLGYLYVLLPTAFFTLLLSSSHLPWFLPGKPAEAGPSRGAIVTPSDVGKTAAAFLARHAPRLAGGTLLALESEDHYLRLHTGAGSELILMRLRDAIGQLTDTPGLQVHRSFWVASLAVARIERRGAQAQLILSNGFKVPVSRTYMTALRDAGWLDGRYEKSA